jgi:hypothetical protein
MQGPWSSGRLLAGSRAANLAACEAYRPPARWSNFITVPLYHNVLLAAHILDFTLIHCTKRVGAFNNHT